MATLPPLIHRFIPEIETFGAHYLEEMRGLAEGARLPLDDIVLINCRTEIVAMARLHEPKPDGCTGLVVMPERSSTGELIHAQNWDWLAECADTAIVLAIRRDDGPDILTFTEAGGLARSGFNANGIAISANYLESDRDYKQSGIPLPLIRRKVLEQRASRTRHARRRNNAQGLLEQHDPELGGRFRDRFRMRAR